MFFNVSLDEPLFSLHLFPFGSLGACQPVTYNASNNEQSLSLSHSLSFSVLWRFVVVVLRTVYRSDEAIRATGGL